jgi:hypothetical protein
MRALRALGLFVCLLLVGVAGAAGASPRPGFALESHAPPPTEPPPISCSDLYPGWANGDRWGPGPNDVIVCAESAPTLPPTDTAP